MAVNMNIATGIKEYRLNDTVSVFFNPTDGAFIQRVYDVFEALDKKQDEYVQVLENAEKTSDMFAILKRLDAEMRELINGLFEDDIMTPLVGKTNLYSLSDGFPIWANLLVAIMDELSSSAEEAEKASKARIAKYTKKYQTSDHKKKGSR